MHTQELSEKVSAALDQLLPCERKAALGVAVSGGPDSVALLGALVTLAPHRDLRITVLHVNHALRPETQQEQHLVEYLCQRWHLPCIVETLTPPPGHTGIEIWARRERYQFFHQAREHYHLDAVALAHTSDDQAETVLFRLLRGSARRGLAGIPPSRDGWIIRPLLGCSRQEVLAYLTAHSLPCAIDTSNADLRYTRNKIRHVLLPFLEQEFSPQVRRHLATLAETLRTEEAWLETLATEARQRVQDSPQVLSLSRLAAEPAGLRPRILRQWVEQSRQVQDLGFRQLARIRALSEGRIQGRIEVPGDLCIKRVGDQLLLEKKGARLVTASPYRYLLTPGQKVTIEELGWHLTMTTPLPWSGASSQAHLADQWQAVFDVSALSDTLIVRNVRPGDRLRLLGMSGHKKVHDVFVDLKVPLAHRRLLPLVTIGGEIAWVPGYVRGERAKVTNSTRQVCWITVNPLPDK